MLIAIEPKIKLRVSPRPIDMPNRIKVLEENPATASTQHPYLLCVLVILATLPSHLSNNKCIYYSVIKSSI